MARFARLAGFFGLDDEGWARHANPWSVWTRFTIMPLLTVVLLAREPLGLWTWALVAALVVFAKVNPRLFSAVEQNNTWAYAAVMGEKLWVAGDERITSAALHKAGVNTIAQAPGVAIWLTGIIFLIPWLAVLGLGLTLWAKIAFLNTLGRAYRDVASSD